MKVYEYIQDPGHGWLKVPLKDLPQGFRPTSFSYYDTRFAYLEEDCDFGAFKQMVPPFDFTEKQVREFDRTKARFSGANSTYETNRSRQQKINADAWLYEQLALARSEQAEREGGRS